MALFGRFRPHERSRRGFGDGAFTRSEESSRQDSFSAIASKSSFSSGFARKSESVQLVISTAGSLLVRGSAIAASEFNCPWFAAVHCDHSPGV